MIAVFLTLLLYRPLHFLLFFYWDLPKLFYTVEDPFGYAHSGYMEKLDRRLLYRYLPAWLFALLLIWIPWPGNEVRLFSSLLLFLIGWRAVTVAVDLATGEKQMKERLQLLLSFALALFFPSFTLPFLTISVNSLRGYDHHSHIPIRTLFMLVIGVLLFGDAEAVSFLALYAVISHYLQAGFAKLKVARSWISLGRLDALPRGSYLWGWLAFLPPPFPKKVSELLKPFSGFKLTAILLLECLSPLLFLTPFFGILLLFFHLGFFLLGGALFWQQMGVLLALFLLKTTLSPLYWLLLLIPPFRAEKLIFYFTPFVQRIDWVAIGVSGKKWGVYNDFMAPNERLYGLIPSCFYLAPYPLLTGHSGETLEVEVAKALQEERAIERAKERLGRSCYDPVRIKMHLHYLDRFFQNFNKGMKKELFPKWLTAPGGELSYSGELPRFKGQEKISKLEIYFKEMSFYEEEPRLLKHKLLATLSLPQA